MPPLPDDPETVARYAYALAAARYGITDAMIAEAIGGEEGPATVAALGEWLARERLRGEVDVAALVHMSAARDAQTLKYAAKVRLRWSDDLPPPIPPTQSIVISIPGLTTQDPTA